MTKSGSNLTLHRPKTGPYLDIHIRGHPAIHVHGHASILMDFSEILGHPSIYHRVLQDHDVIGYEIHGHKDLVDFRGDYYGNLAGECFMAHA